MLGDAERDSATRNSPRLGFLRERDPLDYRRCNERNWPDSSVIHIEISVLEVHWAARSLSERVISSVPVYFRRLRSHWSKDMAFGPLRSTD